MTASNWAACFGATLRHEGGYVDHPADPGGATSLGITIRTLSAWLGRPATKAEVRALTPDAVRPIYRANYWDRVRGDDLPAGVDLVTYDAAVNSGPSRGARWTQEAAGARADGAIGPKTLEALARTPADAVVRRATDLRLGFLRGLPGWRVFGRGWGRRVGEVRALGLQMAGASAAALLADAAALSAAAARQKTASKAVAVTGGAAGSGAAAADAGAAVDWGAVALLAGAAGLLLAAAVLLSIRSRARREAAAAVREHALNMKETPS